MRGTRPTINIKKVITKRSNAEDVCDGTINPQEEIIGIIIWRKGPNMIFCCSGSDHRVMLNEGRIDLRVITSL